jgi:uncharacterized protein (TIGR02145 family)
MKTIHSTNPANPLIGVQTIFTATLALAITFTLSCSGGDDGGDPGSSSGSGSPLTGTSGTFTEGNKSYKWVKIGEQYWMAENLNNDTKGKCYDELQANCTTYGRLYDWSTAMALPSSCNSTSCAAQIKAKHKGICPTGWHIPSGAEFFALMQFVNPSCSLTGNCANAGKMLKSTSGWNEDEEGNDGNGTDEFGFAAKPGGFNSEGFDLIGTCGSWWIANESEDEYDENEKLIEAMGFAIYSHRKDVRLISGDKDGLFSVRCVKD